MSDTLFSLPPQFDRFQKALAVQSNSVDRKYNKIDDRVLLNRQILAIAKRSPNRNSILKQKLRDYP